MPKAQNHRQKVIHPNSRKAAQLSRKEHHNLKLNRRKEELNLKQHAVLKKLNWFKANIDGEKSVCTANDVKDLIMRYFHRFDEKNEEKDELKSMKCRQIHDHLKHQYNFKFNTEKEVQDFETCGLEIPELMKKKSFEFFVQWNGEARYLTNIDMVILSKKNLDNLISKSTSTETSDVNLSSESLSSKASETNRL